MKSLKSLSRNLEPSLKLRFESLGSSHVNCDSSLKSIVQVFRSAEGTLDKGQHCMGVAGDFRMAPFGAGPLTLAFLRCHIGNAATGLPAAQKEASYLPRRFCRLHFHLQNPSALHLDKSSFS